MIRKTHQKTRQLTGLAFSFGKSVFKTRNLFRCERVKIRKEYPSHTEKELARNVFSGESSGRLEYESFYYHVK